MKLKDVRDELNRPRIIASRVEGQAQSLTAALKEDSEPHLPIAYHPLAAAVLAD